VYGIRFIFLVVLRCDAGIIKKILCTQQGAEKVLLDFMKVERIQMLPISGHL